MKDSKGWKLLTDHKHVTMTEEERKEVDSLAPKPPIIPTGYVYSKGTMTKMINEAWEDKAFDFEEEKPPVAAGRNTSLRDAVEVSRLRLLRRRPSLPSRQPAAVEVA